MTDKNSLREKSVKGIGAREFVAGREKKAQEGRGLKKDMATIGGEKGLEEKEDREGQDQTFSLGV